MQNTSESLKARKNLYFSAFYFLLAVEISCSIESCMKNNITSGSVLSQQSLSSQFVAYFGALQPSQHFKVHIMRLTEAVRYISVPRK